MNENPLHEITEALEKAIAANKSLQSHLLAKLKKISELKRENRIKCLKINDALENHLRDEAMKEFGNDEIDFEMPETGKSVKCKQWINEDRKWKRRYFIDPDKCTPSPNTDEIQRRKWEGALASGTYAYRFTAWSKEESNLLITFAEEVRKEQQQQQQQQQQQENDQGGDDAVIVKDADIDFCEVAKRVKDKLATIKFSSAQKTTLYHHNYSLQGTSRLQYTPRSWIDYRVKFLNALSPSINKQSFTKEESLKIIEFLHKDKGNPNWAALAQELNTSRTPFQVFTHAQTKLYHSLRDLSHSSIFTRDEDELFFKFIAASGPQMVINSHTTTVMARRLFPHASGVQILNRANQSFINPQFINEKWSDEEERMLVMGMKVYGENAAPKAALLLDNRASRMVTDKWTRSLNPCYNTQPFSETEDKALIAAVKKRNSKIDNWNNIASKFPTRNPRMIINRWMELGKREDVAKLHGNQFVRWGVKQIGRTVRKSRRKDGDTGEEVLTSSDFAVRFKKRQRIAEETSL